MIVPSQRTVPDNTQHSQQTDIHAPDGIRTLNPSKRAAADTRLRPRGQGGKLRTVFRNGKFVPNFGILIPEISLRLIPHSKTRRSTFLMLTRRHSSSFRIRCRIPPEIRVNVRLLLPRYTNNNTNAVSHDSRSGSSTFDTCHSTGNSEIYRGVRRHNFRLTYSFHGAESFLRS